MSVNNGEQINNRRELNNNFSVYRSNFHINSCKNENNNDTNKDFCEIECEPVESLLFKRKINNQNCDKKLIKNHSMINIKPNFNKKKKDFYINNTFKVYPNAEEIPTFSYENDLNVKSFRSFMIKRNEILRKNYENFVSYLKQHGGEKKKTQLISPYSLYIKKINDAKKYESQILPKLKQREIANLKLNNNRYENQNNNNNYKNLNSFSTSNKNNSKKFDLDQYLEEIARNKEKEIEKNKDCEINEFREKEIENNREKNINYSKSVNDKKRYFPKNNEISNPELFFKKANRDFLKYRKEQKKFDDYNYRIIMIHHRNRFVKKEPDINPYNPKLNCFKVGNSSLVQNVILRPDDCYGNFRYNFKYV